MFHAFLILLFNLILSIVVTNNFIIESYSIHCSDQ